MQSHHAHLLVGSRLWGLSMLPEGERTPSADVSVYDASTFSIQDARKLAVDASLLPVLRPYRTFIVACDTMLHEAQNALLKLFEEPNPDTVFYLIVPREEALLPTLRSRLNLYLREEEGQLAEDFERFQKASYRDRLVLIEEKLKVEDAHWAEDVLCGAERYARESRNPRLIRTVMEVSVHFRGPGASKKMLLEHLALTL